jgi:hypothetical protein
LGIVGYYRSQPLGMTATHKTRETMRLTGDLVLGFLSVEFSFVDRPALTVYLGVVVKRTAEGWSISYYQVSRRGRCRGRRSLGLWDWLPDAGQGLPQLSA